MKKHDQVGGFVWLLLGVGLCLGSFKLKIGGFHNPGAGFIPFWAGVLLGIFGGVLMISSSLKNRGKVEEEQGKKKRVKGDWKNFLIPILILFILFTYVLLLEPLGFLPATFLFLFALFKISEPKKWVMPLLVSLSTVILSYLLFSVWLQCQFPKGILKF
jgi:putative tricarboxylic transport membrane protein